MENNAYPNQSSNNINPCATMIKFGALTTMSAKNGTGNIPQNGYKAKIL
jgi:hypothetical protein